LSSPQLGSPGRRHMTSSLLLIAEVVRTVPHRLRIYNDGPELKSIRALADELQVADSVDFWIPNRSLPPCCPSERLLPAVASRRAGEETFQLRIEYAARCIHIRYTRIWKRNFGHRVIDRIRSFFDQPHADHPAESVCARADLPEFAAK
jgi:hypothetical protein